MNEKKIHKIDEMNKEQTIPIDSVNFTIEKNEFKEDQVEFIKSSLLNHFIFRDMSDDIM